MIIRQGRRYCHKPTRSPQYPQKGVGHRASKGRYRNRQAGRDLQWGRSKRGVRNTDIPGGVNGSLGEYDPTELASPQGFAADPELVTGWYDDRRRTLARSLPNAAHLAMAERPDMTHITQNVDNLLEAAGAGGVLHLHGRIDQDRCNRSCGFIESIDLADPPGLRQCPRCSAAVRPAVVWYGEPLPDAVWQAAVESVEAADVLIVVGTSGVVFPAAGLIDHAGNRGTWIIVINAEPTRSAADIAIIGAAGSILPELLAD